ncbi:MAG: hypothetical protein ACKO6N_23665 [Myxococcota bacterium]
MMNSYLMRHPALMAVMMALSACVPAPEGTRLGGETGTVLDASPEEVSFQLSGLSLDPQAELTLEQLDPDADTSFDDARWEPVASVSLSAPPTLGELRVEPFDQLSDPVLALRLSELTLSVSSRQNQAIAWTWNLSGATHPRLEKGWQEAGVSWFRVLENGVPLRSSELSRDDCDGIETLCSPSSEQFGLVSAASDVEALSPWLSRGQPRLDSSGLSSLEAAERYYEAVEAAPGKARYTLEGWKVINGFPEAELKADYYNGADLGFGREMHCRTLSPEDVGASTPGFACYVTNYGAPSLPAERSLELLVARQNPVATVTMEYRPGDLNNPVRFYAYGAAGERLTQLALDSQGAKPFPGLCVTCHGGTFEPELGRISGAHFLPFDVGLLGFGSQPGKTRDAQQEALRRLNEGVLSTPVTAGIRATLEGMYAPASVSQAEAKAAEQYVTAAWQRHPTLYQQVVRPYCQGCHQALQEGLQLQTPEELLRLRGAILSSVCSTREMPHAELTSQHFWASGARAYLWEALGVTAPCPAE